MATTPGIDQPLSDLTEIITPDLAASVLYLVEGASSKKITGTNLRAVFVTDIAKADLAAALQAEIDAKANISDAAIKALDNIFSGENTFNTINVPTGTLDPHAVNKQQLDWVSNSKADLIAVVLLSGDQNIAGIKTFTQSPIVPTPTTANQVANKDYVDSLPKQTSELVVSNPTTEALNGTDNLQNQINQGVVAFANRFPSSPTEDNLLIWDSATQKYIEQENSKGIIEGFIFEDIANNPVTPSEEDIEFVENASNNTVTMQSKSGKSSYKIVRFQNEGSRIASRVKTISVSLPVVWDLDNFTTQIKQTGFDGITLKLAIDYVLDTVSVSVGKWINPAKEGGFISCYSLPTLDGELISGAGQKIISVYGLNNHGYLFDLLEQNRITGSIVTSATSFKFTQTFSQWRGANVINPVNKLSPRIRTIPEIPDSNIFISYIDSSGDIQFLRPNPGLTGIAGYVFPGLPAGTSALYGYIDESLDINPTSVNRLVELDDADISEETVAIDMYITPSFIILSYPLIGNTSRILNIGNTDPQERENSFKSFSGVAPSLDALGIDVFSNAAARVRVVVIRGQASVWHEDYALLLSTVEGGGFSQQGNTNSNAISYDPKGNTVEDELTYLNTKTTGIIAATNGVIEDAEAIKINANKLIEFDQTATGEVDLNLKAETIVISASRTITINDIGKTLIIDTDSIILTLPAAGPSFNFSSTRVIDKSPDGTARINDGVSDIYMFGESLIVAIQGSSWYIDRPVPKAKFAKVGDIRISSIGGYITPFQSRFVASFGDTVYNASIDDSGTYNSMTIHTPYYLGLPIISDLELFDGMKIKVKIGIGVGKTATGNGTPAKLINVIIDFLPSKVILNSYRSTINQQVSAIESENLFIQGSIVELTYNEIYGGFNYRIIEEYSDGINAEPISNATHFLDGNRGYYKRTNGIISLGITAINTNDSTSNQWNTYYNFPQGYRSVEPQVHLGRLGTGGSRRLNGIRMNIGGQLEVNWFEAGGFVQVIDTKRWEVRRP